MAAYKISKSERRHWLTIWPFEASDLERLMTRSRIAKGKRVYVNIAHESWQGSTRLPSAKEVAAQPLAQGAIGVISDPQVLWRNRSLAGIVDLQLYIPDQPIDTEELNILNEASVSGAYDDILHRWGGCALFLHDLTKLNLDYVPSSPTMQEIFAWLLAAGRADDAMATTAETDILWGKLNRLPSDQCAVIASNAEGCFLFKQTDEALLRYEQTTSLFPPNEWQNLLDSAGRESHLPSPARNRAAR